MTKKGNNGIFSSQSIFSLSSSSSFSFSSPPGLLLPFFHCNYEKKQHSCATVLWHLQGWEPPALPLDKWQWRMSTWNEAFWKTSSSRKVSLFQLFSYDVNHNYPRTSSTPNHTTCFRRARDDFITTSHDVNTPLIICPKLSFSRDTHIYIYIVYEYTCTHAPITATMIPD